MDVSSGDEPAARTHNPSTPAKRVKKTEYRRQTKMIIQNIYNFFVKHRLAPEKLDFTKTQNVTAEACGVSLSTVQKVAQENRNNKGQFLSPRKSISSKRPKTDLDDFNKDVVRRIIYDFYDEGQFPTAQKILGKLRKKINYQGSVRSVTRIIHNNGFSFKKCKGGRKFLMERGDIVVKRLEFLRKMNTIREQTPQRPIFYLDETWIHQNHIHIVLLHIGSAKTGFIPELLYKNTKKVSANFDSVMNADIFKQWFKNMLIMLNEPSVIVMDNASYHSMEINKAPSINTKKEIIQDWLTEKNISFSPVETKIELFEKVKANKNKERVYELDEEAIKVGHEIVRLPPFYGQYNPIELAWAQIKEEVVSKNHTFKTADVEKLTNEAIQNVTTEDWSRYVEHAEKLQKEDMEKELVREVQMERIIMTINPDNDDSDFRLSDDSDDDDEF